MEYKRLLRLWQDFKKKRMLKAFYARERTKPQGEKFFRYFLILLGAFYLVLQNASSLINAYFMATSVVFILTAAYILTERLELKHLREKCRKNMAREEFRKRLEQAEREEIMQTLAERLIVKYNVKDLSLADDRLLGSYRGKPLAVYYFGTEGEDAVETKELIAVIRKCRREGIDQVRAFTNNQFSFKAASLRERFELDLKLYEGSKLFELLKDTAFSPSAEDVDNLILKESENRKRKMAIIKDQALQGEKSGNYLLYGSLLFALAWFEIGSYYLNLVFGGIMYTLFFSTLLKRFSKKKEDLIL